MKACILEKNNPSQTKKKYPKKNYDYVSNKVGGVGTWSDFN